MINRYFKYKQTKRFLLNETLKGKVLPKGLSKIRTTGWSSGFLPKVKSQDSKIWT